MQASNFICPHCMCPAQLPMFENVGGGELRCRRCRSRFKDPNAYAADVAYADCDGSRPVTRFPFSLSGNSAIIHVREGYIAFLVRPDGRMQWIEKSDCRLADALDGAQLYYICLSPRVSWGVSSLKEFGAYGSAQLSLSVNFVMNFCSGDGQALALEDHLRKIVSRHIAGHMQTEIDRQSMNLLENRDVYMGMTGALEDGVSLVRIDPRGFRNANGKIGSFSVYLPPEEQAEAAADLSAYRPPVEIVNSPKPAYTIKPGIEEVFCFGSSKLQRHKAGETVDAESLRGVDRLVRYKVKEFEYPFGWGIYNQPQTALGFYSAQGTISFYIDSTERFSLLLYKAKNWRDFEAQFFTNILRRELSEAIREVMGARIGQQNFQPERIGDYLSAMSVDLTNLLNGESRAAKEPVFRQYGLRVKQTDILGINFYAVRR